MMLYTNGLILTLRNKVVYNHPVLSQAVGFLSKITSGAGCKISREVRHYQKLIDRIK